jgi:hypothetical protein
LEEIEQNDDGGEEDDYEDDEPLQLNEDQANNGDEIENLYHSVLALTREKDPINEYKNPLLWYDAFPTLFPHRRGAPEGDTRYNNKLSITDWIKHVLNIADVRFRNHAKFIFFVGNMMKRRDVCLHAKIKLKSSGYKSVINGLRTLEVKELGDALLLAQENKPVTDPRIRVIIDNLKCVGSKVRGSTFSRIAARMQIMSMQMFYCQPKFYVTINPYDYDSSVLLFFNGVEHNISEPFSDALHFMKRKQIVTKDPISAAQFFHLTISCFIKHLLNVQSNDIGIVG